MRKLLIVDYVNVTIKRPSGQIEVVNITKALGVKNIDKNMEKRITADTKAANMGDVLKFEVVKKEIDHPISELEQYYIDLKKIENMSRMGD